MSLKVFSSSYVHPADEPMPNGCYRCIGCYKILPKSTDWNQCPDCDTREPEER